MQKVSQQLIKIAKILYAAQTPPHFMDILLKATKEKCAITFDYQSINTKKTKKYTVMPLQIKKRILKNGNVFVLYAQDVNENNRTKSFVIKYMFKLKLTPNVKNRIRPNLLQKRRV